MPHKTPTKRTFCAPGQSPTNGFRMATLWLSIITAPATSKYEYSWRLLNEFSRTIFDLCVDFSVCWLLESPPLLHSVFVFSPLMLRTTYTPISYRIGSLLNLCALVPLACCNLE